MYADGEYNHGLKVWYGYLIDYYDDFWHIYHAHLLEGIIGNTLANLGAKVPETEQER